MFVEPTEEFRLRLEGRNALVVQRSKHRPTYDDLSARIPLALRLVGSSGQAIAFRT